VPVRLGKHRDIIDEIVDHQPGPGRSLILCKRADEVCIGQLGDAVRQMRLGMSWQAMRGGDDLTVIFASADHKATAIADLHDSAFRLLECPLG
jgi:hypothetical protein